MTLINLSTTPEKIETYNNRIKHCKEGYPEFTMDYIKDLNDLFPTYESVINDPENKDIISDVKDDIVDFTGFYVKSQLERWTEFINEKLMDKNPFYISDTYPGTLDYGVADNASQVLKYFQNIEKEEGIDLGKCVICLHPIAKKYQPEEGGWRWHKWGPYIGVKKPQCEYIYDEDDSIKFVWCFHIYKMM